MTTLTNYDRAFEQKFMYEKEHYLVEYFERHQPLQILEITFSLAFTLFLEEDTNKNQMDYRSSFLDSQGYFLRGSTP